MRAAVFSRSSLIVTARIAIGCLATLGLATGIASAQTYGIATMQPGTLSNATGSAIAKVMQQQLKLQTRVQPNAGESTLLPLVDSGEIDLGIANIFEVVQAYQGKAAAGKQEKLRIVGAIHPIRIGFFVRKDSNIKTIADLRGKRVTLGFSAMRTIDDVALALLATGGLTASDVQAVLVPNVVRSAESFMSGQADCFVFALGAGKVTEVDASVGGGIRILPISSDPNALAAAQKIFTALYLTEVTPRPGLTGVPEKLKVLSYDNLLVTGADAKDELVYNVVDAMVRNKGDLAASAPWLAELAPDQLYKKYPVPYHPGAVKWFKEKGLAPQ